MSDRWKSEQGVQDRDDMLRYVGYRDTPIGLVAIHDCFPDSDPCHQPDGPGIWPTHCDRPSWAVKLKVPDEAIYYLLRDAHIWECNAFFEQILLGLVTDPPRELYVKFRPVAEIEAEIAAARA